MGYLDARFPSLTAVLQGIDGEYERINSEKRREEEQFELDKRSAVPNDLESAGRDPFRAKALARQLNLNLEAQIQTLEELYAYKESLKAIREAFATAKEALDLLPRDPEAAAILYHDIKLTPDPKTSLKAASALKDARESLNSSARAPIMATLLDQLTLVLQTEDWPKRQPKSQEFLDALANCLRVEDANEIVLDSFFQLAAPFDLRVKFNFESAYESNRADKPEWLFSYFFKLLDPHIKWLAEVVQPILDKALSGRYALVELCSALLPSFFRVLQNYMERVEDSPELVSHLMTETIKFDSDLRDRYHYLPGTGRHWSGLTMSLLDYAPQWRSLWIQNERTGTLEQLENILSASTAWNIDWDNVDAEFTKPTVSALNVGQLFDSITQTYQNVSNADLQAEFLADTQVPLIENYCSELTGRMVYYAGVHSSFGRAVRTVSAEDRKKFEGMNGFEYLAKILGSVEYIVTFLRAQGDNALFDENSDSNSSLLTLSKISDEMKELKARAIKEMVGIVNHEFQEVAKKYYRQSWKLEFTPIEVAEEMKRISARLDPYLKFLGRFASRADSLELLHKFTSKLSDHIYMHVINGNTFNQNGGTQLEIDLRFLQQYLELPETRQWHKLCQAATFLADGQTPLLHTAEERENLQKRKKN